MSSFLVWSLIFLSILFLRMISFFKVGIDGFMLQTYIFYLFQEMYALTFRMEDKQQSANI